MGYSESAMDKEVYGKERAHKDLGIDINYVKIQDKKKAATVMHKNGRFLEVSSNTPGV